MGCPRILYKSHSCTTSHEDMRVRKFSFPSLSEWQLDDGGGCDTAPIGIDGDKLSGCSPERFICVLTLPSKTSATQQRYGSNCTIAIARR